MQITSPTFYCKIKSNFILFNQCRTIRYIERFINEIRIRKYFELYNFYAYKHTQIYRFSISNLIINIYTILFSFDRYTIYKD